MNCDRCHRVVAHVHLNTKTEQPVLYGDELDIFEVATPESSTLVVEKKKKPAVAWSADHELKWPVRQFQLGPDVYHWGYNFGADLVRVFSRPAYRDAARLMAGLALVGAFLTLVFYLSEKFVESL
jgi:hypothetical protein